MARNTHANTQENIHDCPNNEAESSIKPAPERIAHRLGRLLQTVRRVQGKNQQEIADLCGIKRQQVCIVEKASRDYQISAFLRMVSHFIEQGWLISEEVTACLWMNEIDDGNRMISSTITVNNSNDLERLVGEKVRSWRELRGFSQEMLADKCGISIGTVHSVESARKSPSLRTLSWIAQALQIELRDLLP